MRNYSTDEIRNIVILGSSKSGKTILTESMMYEGKVIARRGSIEQKNTISDNTEIEQLYQRSIYSTLLYTEFMDHKLNIIDTPGSDDFVGGVISAFSVADTGVLVVNAQQGVEIGTQIFARYATNYNKPLIIGVNQLDHEKADWDDTLASLQETFGSKLALVQFPVNPGSGFNSFIDVLKMKKYTFTDDQGTRIEENIPEEYAEKAARLHQELIEKSAENDDTLMETFFEKGILSEDEIRAGMRERRREAGRIGERTDGYG